MLAMNKSYCFLINQYRASCAALSAKLCFRRAYLLLPNVTNMPKMAADTRMLCCTVTCQYHADVTLLHRTLWRVSCSMQVHTGIQDMSIARHSSAKDLSSNTLSPSDVINSHVDVNTSLDAAQSADEDKRELVVYIDDDYNSIKAVDLYGRIKQLDAEQILCLVEQSGLQLDKTHLALCLKRLFTLSMTMRKELSDDFKSRVLDHRFQILSALLAKKARFLEPSIVADMLSFFVHFGLSSHDPVVMIFLQLVTRHINNLSLDQLATMAYNCSQLDATHQTQVLLKALAVLCNTRAHQLATLSIEHRIFLLDAFGPDLHYSTSLVRACWRDRFEITRPRTAVGLLAAIGRTDVGSHMGEKTVFRRHPDIEDWCINTVLQKSKWLDCKEIRSLLVACRQLHIYNSRLLHEVGTLVSVELSLCLTERLSVWSLLTGLGYLHSKLSSAMLDGIDDSTVRSLSAESCVTLLRVLAEKVRPDSCPSENDVFQLVDESTRKIVELVDDRMIQCCQMATGAVVLPESILDACLYMIAVGHKPSPVLVDLCLQNLDSYLTNVESDRDFSQSEKLLLLLLHLQLQHYEEESMNIRITEAVIRAGQQQLYNTNRTCLSPAFRLLNVWVSQPYVSSTGLHADHLLSNIATHQPRMVVLSWHYGKHFWRSNNRLLSIAYLYARTLQTLDKRQVAVVNADMWLTMSERERIDYLKHKVLHSASSLTIV